MRLLFKMRRLPLSPHAWAEAHSAVCAADGGAGVQLLLGGQHLLGSHDLCEAVAGHDSHILHAAYSPISTLHPAAEYLYIKLAGTYWDCRCEDNLSCLNVIMQRISQCGELCKACHCWREGSACFVLIHTLAVLEVQERWAGSLGWLRAKTLFRFCARLQAAASRAATAGLSRMVGQAWAASRARAETMRFTASAAEALFTRSSRRIPLTASSSPIVKGFTMLAAGFRLQLECIMLPLDSCVGTVPIVRHIFCTMMACAGTITTKHTAGYRKPSHDAKQVHQRVVMEVQVYLAAADAALGGDSLQVYKGVAGACACAKAAEGARAAVERNLKGAAGKGRCGQLR